MQFFTETMHAFNKMIGDYLKKELGCKQLVNAGNWRTADNVTMLDAERWSYTANEVMAVNRYYGGAHEGQNNGWAIVNGDRFTDDCAMLHPREMPLTLKQVDGFPMMITESSWVPPQGYQSEGPFLVAAYQSLTGIDAYYWFATGEEDWRQPGSANGFMPSEGKWVCATPMLMGQWPAAALMYRLGYIQQGEPVVYEQRSLDRPLAAADADHRGRRGLRSQPRQGQHVEGVERQGRRQPAGVPRRPGRGEIRRRPCRRAARSTFARIFARTRSWSGRSPASCTWTTARGGVR